MSAKLQGLVWTLQFTTSADDAADRVSPRGKRDVVLAMADNADDHGYCFPGVEYLAWKTDYSERQVQRILRSLERDGLVEVLNAGGGAGRRRRYRLHLDRARPKPAFVPRNHDTMSPFGPARDPGNGDTMSPNKGDTMSPNDGKRVTPRGQKGDATVTRTVSRTVRERRTTSSPRSPATTSDVPPEVVTLCQQLAERIVANGASSEKYAKKAGSAAWQRAMRLLLDEDLKVDHAGNQVPYQERVAKVGRAIDWAQADAFWRGNILSPASLRDQYDRLRLAAARPNGHRPSTPPPEPPPPPKLGNGDPRRPFGGHLSAEDEAELDRRVAEEWAGREVLRMPPSAKDGVVPPGGAV